MKKKKKNKTKKTPSKAPNKFLIEESLKKRNILIGKPKTRLT